MPRLVTKFKYLKPGGGGKSVGGYARYIATREGVERIDDSHRHAPATQKQQALVEKLLRDFPEIKGSHEYEDFLREQTVGNASEFISMAIEENLDAVANTKTYADYIATRPRAERFGSHGLFTDDGVQVQLSKVSQELNAYKGNVYTAILSLKREDAARLGFDNGSRWRDFLRGQTQTLAENLKIPMEHLRWYAAFHNEGHHPHVHLIAYSTVPGEGHLSKQGMENMRSAFAREIFSQELLFTYQQQTEYRNQLREQGRESISDIVAQINAGTYQNPRIEELLLQLSDRLSRTTGKKVYGYLKADVKAIVDQIVAELAGDENIRKLYDLWYEQREDVLRTYTDTFPERIPLERNKEFKSIRNAVIQEAMKIATGIHGAADLEPQRDMADIGLPMGEESIEPLEDPAYWMEHFKPRISNPDTSIKGNILEDFQPETVSSSPSFDSKNWWSDSYKAGRKYLYGTKEENPDFQKAMALLLPEANAGNGYARYDVGRMYLLGQGCEANEEEAQQWFQNALEAFHKAEQTVEKKEYLRYRIGKCYAYGHGVERNYEEAAWWFRRAEGNPFAAYSLGGQYLRGQGVEQSDMEAYNLFYRAATHHKQPNAYAQYQLGRMYRDGIGTAVNPVSSKQWYEKAYRGFLAMEQVMADDRLYYRLGSMNFAGTGTELDLEQARYYFEKAAELGNADSLYGLGKLYLKPEFRDYDPAKAIEYLERAVAKDHAFAKYQLGKLLCQGEFVEKDISRGLPMLDELAQGGVSYAAYIVGKVYLKEEGWQDVKKAILYFQQAAEDGNPYAEYQLGKLYYFGNGVRADQETGLEYLKASAAHGNQYAANLLQTIQHQHTWGVAQGAASLIAQLGRMFQEQEQKQDQRQSQRMDRKQRREIEEKKQAMGIRD